MKRFSCPSCANEVYFNNAHCVACATPIAFDPWALAFLPVSAGTPCANAGPADCNWLSAPGSEFCVACQYNKTVPDTSSDENRARWAKIEDAKRRLFYSLIRWNLPIPIDGPTPLQFDFLADTTDRKGRPKTVLTGHDNGLITLNIAEGDDAEREARRSAMGEPFRTLVGHMRHEIAHFYWEILVRDTPALQDIRAVFGDETADYGDALQSHYDTGAPADWPQSFVSSYATSHPWEDFAETFAHWVHIVDGLETAWAFGIAAGPGSIRFDPYTAPDAQSVIDAWVPVTIAINAVNRSLGQPDLYPFVLSTPVMDKLQAIHALVAPFRS